MAGGSRAGESPSHCARQGPEWGAARRLARPGSDSARRWDPGNRGGSGADFKLDSASISRETDDSDTATGLYFCPCNVQWANLVMLIAQCLMRRILLLFNSDLFIYLFIYWCLSSAEIADAHRQGYHLPTCVEVCDDDACIRYKRSSLQLNNFLRRFYLYHLIFSVSDSSEKIFHLIQDRACSKSSHDFNGMRWRVFLGAQWACLSDRFRRALEMYTIIRLWKQ